MKAYLLDTNIVSMLDPKRHPKAPALIDWLDRNGARLFLSEGNRNMNPQLAAAPSLVVSRPPEERNSDRIPERGQGDIGVALHQRQQAVIDFIECERVFRHAIILRQGVVFFNRNSPRVVTL